MSDKDSKNLQGTWVQALVSFLFPIFLVLSLRWALAEPFIIPSESMLPNLLVNDQILVKKFSYGIKLPFTQTFLWQWSSPQRGDIIVFRYPENPQVFYVKRVVGVPGDEIKVKDGRVTLNGATVKLEIDELEPRDSDEYFRFRENQYVVRFQNREAESEYLDEKFLVPEGKYFVLGDNRHHSADSRVWGFVDRNLLVGEAWFVWMSCDQTLQSIKFLCDPTKIRNERLFKRLDIP
ncbi:MAG: signal peptidase I [Bdellovibrionia bacterium]